MPQVVLPLWANTLSCCVVCAICPTTSNARSCRCGARLMRSLLAAQHMQAACWLEQQQVLA